MAPKQASRQLISLEEWEAEQMADPAFVAALAELEPAYQVARLRILRGLTQEQLAELVGTKQPGIARLESGVSTPTLSFLRKVAAALGARLEVRLVPLQEEEQVAELFGQSHREGDLAALHEDRTPYDTSDD
jgi:transcriptional regulator with XRE-family HTH domain